MYCIAETSRFDFVTYFDISLSYMFEPKKLYSTY